MGRDELLKAYNYCVSSKEMKPTRFTRMAKINGVEFKRCRIDGKTTQAFQTTLTGEDEQEILFLAEHKPQSVIKETTPHGRTSAS